MERQEWSTEIVTEFLEGRAERKIEKLHFRDELIFFQYCLTKGLFYPSAVKVQYEHLFWLLQNTKIHWYTLDLRDAPNVDNAVLLFCVMPKWDIRYFFESSWSDD